MSEIEILEFQSFICLQTSRTNCISSIVFVILAFYMIVKGIVHPPSIYSIMYMTCVMYFKSSKIIQYNSVEETDQNVSLIMVKNLVLFVAFMSFWGKEWCLHWKYSIDMQTYNFMKSKEYSAKISMQKSYLHDTYGVSFWSLNNNK